MIGFWGRISRSERARARRVLSLLRVPQAVGRSWEVLSQGERQRVLIARALMAKPAILILDEPCEGLDPVARERFLDDVRKLAKRKNAPGLVLVTHDIEEIVPEFTAAPWKKSLMRRLASGSLTPDIICAGFRQPDGTWTCFWAQRTRLLGVCLQDGHDRGFLSDRSLLEPSLSSCLRPLNHSGIAFVGASVVMNGLFVIFACPPARAPAKNLACS